MPDDIDRRTVLVATGSAMAIGVPGIASGRRRPADDGATEVVTVGLTHELDAPTDGLEVWTVDDIPAYRVREDSGEVAIHGHPVRDVAAAFRRSPAVADVRGHPRASAVALDAAAPRAAVAGADPTASSIVTELGPQHRVLERIPTVDDYEPPRVATQAAADGVGIETAEDGERFVLAVGEGRTRRLEPRTVALRTRDGGAREIDVTPVVRAQHHGRLEIVEEPPVGKAASRRGGR